MKRCYFFLAGMIGVLMFLASSCVKTSPEYSTKGTGIHITLDEKALSSTRVKVDFVLDDDEHYYFCEIIPRDKYTVQEDNSKFMQLIVDSVYTEYVNWRYDYLKQDEEYIASFPSHCLWYGNDYWEFSGLSPDTEYTIVAFCVDPALKQPIGEMYYLYVKTLPVKKSSMTFKFYCEEDITKATYTVEPSNDIEPYYADYIDSDTIDENYGGSLQKYVDEFISGLNELSESIGYDVLSDNCYKRSQNFNIPYVRPIKYYMFAFGYDGMMTTDIFYKEFTFVDPLL